MAIPQRELPNHDRFGTLPRVEPRMRILGRCPCGCNEILYAGYEAIRWDDKTFYDEFHLVRYLERTDGAERVS